MSTAPHTNCKLCGAKAQLRKSHIIPEFCYKPMYDPLHRFFVLNANAEVPKTFGQKGLREHLLCDTCEGKFSVVEKYTSEIFNQSAGQRTKRNGDWLHLYDLDYSKIKLFFMSLIWRMSVSSLPMFQKVALGPHEAKLAAMLDAGQPGQPDQYPCLLTAITVKGKFYPGWILEPDPVRAFGQRAYRIIISGILYTFIVGSHAAPSELVRMCINSNGEMSIKVEEVGNIEFLAEAWSRFNKSLTKRPVT